MIDPKTRVLVVDDMRTMRKIIMKNLKDMGFTDVTEADDGKTAWAEIEKANGENKPFGLVISDWNMPQMKGIELLKLVRAIPVMKKTPFLLVTAETEMVQVKEAMASGVSGYITKPFGPDVFQQKLNAIK